MFNKKTKKAEERKDPAPPEPFQYFETEVIEEARRILGEALQSGQLISKHNILNQRLFVADARCIPTEENLYRADYRMPYHGPMYVEALDTLKVRSYGEILEENRKVKEAALALATKKLDEQAEEVKRLARELGKEP